MASYGETGDCGRVAGTSGFRSLCGIILMDVGEVRYRLFLDTHASKHRPGTSGDFQELWVQLYLPANEFVIIILVID